MLRDASGGRSCTSRVGIFFLYFISRNAGRSIRIFKKKKSFPPALLPVPISIPSPGRRGWAGVVAGEGGEGRAKEEWREGEIGRAHV